MSFDPNVSLFLSATLATKDATHAVMKHDQPSYRFNAKDTESDFYLSYMKLLPEIINGTYKSSIGEFADEYAPVIYSFQGILPVTEETSQIPSDLLISLTELLQQLTRKMGNMSGQSLFENSQLTCILLARTREEEQYYVYDLMFYFPGAVESREKIEQQLYGKVEEYLSAKRYNYKVNFEGFESDLYTRPIPMYGATIDDEFPYDYISYITMGSTTRINTEDPPHRIFAIADTALYKRELITSEEVGNWNQIEMDQRSEQVIWLPIILSVRGNYQASSLKPQEKIVKSDFIIFDSKAFKKNPNDPFVIAEADIPMNEIRKFVLGWHPFRIDHQVEWKLIGEALFNFYRGDIKGLLTWESIVDEIVVLRRQILRKFNLNDDGSLINPPPGLTAESERALLNQIYDDEAFKVTNYLDITERDRKIKTRRTAVPLYIIDEGRTIYRKFYFSFKVDRITYITLAENYKEDCPVDFAHWHSDWVKSAVINGASGLDTDIAISLYRFLFLEWFCYTANGRDPIYCRQEGNRNREDEGKFILKKIIVTKFLDFYSKLLYDLKKEKAPLATKDAAGGEINLLISKVESVVALIKSQSFKERLIKEAAIFFNKQSVATFFDDNRELTCVNNGVIVAGAKGIIFRKGRLEDYITKRFGTFYIDSLDEKDPCVVRLMTWSKETFVANEPMISWWWKYLASTFRGGNDDKIFPFFFGRKGNEGKSAWTNFLEMMMGCYCSNVEISYFTNTPKDSNSATPVTAMIYNAHLVLTEEAEDTRPIRSGAFKKKTGKDRVNKRNLYGKAEVVDFQAKFLGVGNVLPTFSKIGTAEEERFWVVPVTSQRSREAENWTEEEQYKKKMFFRDNFFDQNLQYYLTAGIWILVRYYSRYVEEGLAPYPEKMVKATKAYWLDHDKFRRFAEFAVEIYKKEDDSPGAVKKEDFVDMKTIYDLFKEWHDDQYPKDKILNIDEVRRELRDRWGKIVHDKFYGVRLRSSVKAKPPAIGGKKQREHGADSF